MTCGRLLPVILGVLIALETDQLIAGTFIQSETLGADLVTHPQGYSGSGAALNIDVCIVTGSPNQSAIEVAVRNTVDRYNLLIPTIGNIRLAPDNELAANEVDFESVFLHELGHCIGLEHPNLGDLLMGGGPDANHTRSLPGMDLAYDLDDGADNIIGSGDDLRDDDVNLHWFFVGSNNPFDLTAEPDGSTFSRNLIDLPMADNYPANGDRTVSTIFGLPVSEAVMQQGLIVAEEQRSLSADDVATLQFARTGIDRISGNADDYSVNLNFILDGDDPDCDLFVEFDDIKTSLAACETLPLSTIDAENAQITTANIYFNSLNLSMASWYFSQFRIPFPAVDWSTVGKAGFTSLLDGGGDSLLANDTDQQGDGLLISADPGYAPEHGSVVLESDGKFTYTHNGDNATSDRFVYRVCGDNGLGVETNACSHQWAEVRILPAVFAACAPGGQRGVAGLPLSIQTSSTFVGVDLSYSASGLPASLDIDSVSGEISGIPTSIDFSNSPFFIEVTASGIDPDQVIGFQLTIDASPDVILYSDMEGTCLDQ
jgi:hypothetical protein